MTSNKRYFWLKLNENFFEDDTIAWIEEQDNGTEYIIFYLKLALKSLTDDGYLIRYVGEKLIPYDVKALAKLTNTDTDTVRVAMNLFLEVGILSQLDSGEIYLNQIDEMIGSETESAKRVRKHRAKQNLLQSNGKALQSNSGVIESNTEKEIERELEKELEKELDIDIDSPAKAEPDIPFKEIVEFLNDKTNSNYRHTSKATQQLIKARVNDGFEQDDFKQVIEVKANQWLNDKEMAKYLRPQTLFGTKFESYLNEQSKTFNEPKIADFNNDEAFLERGRKLLEEQQRKEQENAGHTIN